MNPLQQAAIISRIGEMGQTSVTVAIWLMRHGFAGKKGGPATRCCPLAQAFEDAVGQPVIVAGTKVGLADNWPDKTLPLPSHLAVFSHNITGDY